MTCNHDPNLTCKHCTKPLNLNRRSWWDDDNEEHLTLRDLVMVIAGVVVLAPIGYACLWLFVAAFG